VRLDVQAAHFHSKKDPKHTEDREVVENAVAYPLAPSLHDLCRGLPLGVLGEDGKRRTASFGTYDGEGAVVPV
jgi:hypothetical protein